MLRDDSAWVDYVISSIGILFAGSILLLAICGVFKLTIPANEQILLQDIASEIACRIEEVDLKQFPYRHSFWLNDGSYRCAISCEYITVSSSNQDASYVRPLHTCVYPASNLFWNNTSDMRLFLKKEFGGEGDREHGLDSANASNLSRLFYSIALNSSLHPVTLNRDRQLLLEKEYIYFDNGKRRGYVFVSQQR